MRDGNGRSTPNRLKTATVLWLMTVVAFAIGVILLAADVPSWGAAVIIGVAVGSMVAALMTVKKKPQS